MLSGKYSARHLFRLNWNHKYKQRDRYKPKLAKMLDFDIFPKYKRFRRWARDSYRRKSAPALGYGVDYERDADDGERY